MKYFVFQLSYRLLAIYKYLNDLIDCFVSYQVKGRTEPSQIELRSVTCDMGIYSVTCHRTQVNAPHLNPSQIGWYSIYLPRKDGRLS